jgi:hypothetical protein
VLRRVANPALADQVARLGQDPRRKLRRSDRLVGPALLAQKHGIRPVHLARAIAAGLLYHNPADPGAVWVQERVAALGVAGALREVCELTLADAELAAMVEAAFGELNSSRQEETMIARVPEKKKKAGVCYAVTDDGIELPVIDITHPAFAFEISEAELSALIDSMQRSAKIPAAALQSAAEKSLLVRGIVESAGTFTTGMMTYLNKLGPDNLGDGYAGPLDRQWAASLTPVSFRWRMRDVARLLADGLAPALAARPRSAVHLLNIGGGPAMDSLNALILVQKEQPAWLTGRAIRIHVLDLDEEGPRFGARALTALLAEGAPLHALDIALDYVAYNWGDTTVLRRVIDQIGAGNVVVAGSTEGGLFEYATDEEIVANLKVIRVGTPDNFVMVGPVVRDPQSCDPRLRAMEQVEGRPAIRFIGLEAFRGLAGNAGWAIERSLDGPVHQVVSLKKA